MSIRLRLTLLYSAILALTLMIFGVALYTIQAQYTLDSLKSELTQSGDNLAAAVLWRQIHPPPAESVPQEERRPPVTFESFTDDPSFRRLPEREIVRVLDASGQLVASPFGVAEDALPLSAEGLQMLQQDLSWWETSSTERGRLLIYSTPVVADGKLIAIVQVARPLAERDRSLSSLGITLLAAGVLTSLIAFGIGWWLSGLALRPIHRITQTAQAIGKESDLSRRVDYTGPNDEIGQLATTFNSMLARLQEAYQQVSRSLKEQRDFVADVSHELRTPLTTVRGNLALLRRDPPLPQTEQAEVLDDVVEESDRMVRLVNDLLVLARADAGQNLMRAPVALKAIAEEACRQTSQFALGREVSLMAQDIAVLGDHDAIKQVLLILLDNALKHAVGSIRVTVEKVDGKAIISVQDNGPGIAPEALEHIFDRFYRGDANPDTPGFGLGLPIAKALVEELGGSIQIKSQPGTGSLVQVEFPAL